MAQVTEDIRPEIVQRIAHALRDGFDTGVPAEIAEIAGIADVDLEVTAAGVAAAERRLDVYAYLADTSVPRRVRMREALAILTRSSGRPDASWAACFDSLTADDLARLRELYDALPETARVEYDRRYGPSELDDE